MTISRRGFLGAILAAGVAPFVVRAESLMAVRVPPAGIIVPDFISVDKHVVVDGDDDIPEELARQIRERMELTRLMIIAGVWENGLSASSIANGV